MLKNAATARERYQAECLSEENTIKEDNLSDESSDEGEEFDEDNNDEEEGVSPEDEEDEEGGAGESADNDSVSSSLVDSGIENNEISSLSIDNGHTSGEGWDRWRPAQYGFSNDLNMVGAGDGAGHVIITWYMSTPAPVRPPVGSCWLVTM